MITTRRISFSLRVTAMATWHRWSASCWPRGDQMRARVWWDSHGPVDAVAVRVVGSQLTIQSPRLETSDPDFLARQALAFGASLNARLRGMRIGVGGLWRNRKCGGHAARATGGRPARTVR